jgi:hypothetical protein
VTARYYVWQRDGRAPFRCYRTPAPDPRRQAWDGSDYHVGLKIAKQCNRLVTPHTRATARADQLYLFTGLAATLA